jgi:hypothetical protein
LKNVKPTVIDQPPTGLSVGDERLGHGDLYKGTKRVGNLAFVLTVTNTRFKSGVIQLKVAETFTLPGGTIEAAGVSYRPSLTVLPPSDTYAITGGTGRYVGASGQLIVKNVAPGVLSETFLLR